MIILNQEKDEFKEYLVSAFNEIESNYGKVKSMEIAGRVAEIRT